MRSESIANTLVTNKCDMDALNSKGQTLLHLAIMRGDTFAANFLIRNGSNPLATISSNQFSPLHLVATYNPSKVLGEVSSILRRAPWPSEDMADIATLLLEYHANPDSQDQDGNTALHHCITSGNHKVFCILMNHER